MNGLKFEWKCFLSSIKAHEQFKSYSLAKMVEILRSQENEVREDAKFVPNGSLLSFFMKANGSKVKKSKVFEMIQTQMVLMRNLQVKLKLLWSATRRKFSRKISLNPRVTTQEKVIMEKVTSRMKKSNYEKVKGERYKSYQKEKRKEGDEASRRLRVWSQLFSWK